MSHSFTNQTILILFTMNAIVQGCNSIGEPISGFPQNAGEILQDASVIRLDCDQNAKLPGTLALYCFDAEDVFHKVTDSTKNHPAKVVGTKIRRVKGPIGCAMAVRFSETNASTYIEIPNSKEWDLDMGSLGLWLRLDSCPSSPQGVISRDSINPEELGGFALILLPDCKWSIRIKTGNGIEEVYADSSISPGVWSHLDINFGRNLEIYQDGHRVGGAKIDQGLAGNDNPWLIGADSRLCKKGEPRTPTDFLKGVSLDLIRIGSQPRDVSVVY